MVRSKKRIWALLLVIAMVFSLCPALPARAEGSKMQVSGHKWNDQTRRPEFSKDDFKEDWWLEVKGGDYISLQMEDATYGYLPCTASADSFVIKNEAGEVVTEEVASFGKTGWFQDMTKEEGTYIEEDLPVGVYSITIREAGDYTLMWNEDPESYFVKIHVNYPNVGLYSTNTLSSAGLVDSNGPWYQTVPGNKYYILPGERVAKDDNITEVSVSFREDIGKENIPNWKTKGSLAPIEVDVPLTLVNGLPDFAWVEIRFSDREPEYRNISLDQYRMGIMAGDIEYDDKMDRDAPVDPEKSPNRYGKERTVALRGGYRMALGVSDGDTITLLTQKDLPKLSFVDEKLNPVPELISIDMAEYWDEGANEGEGAHVKYDNIFCITPNKKDKYYLKYVSDTDEVSYVEINVCLPEFGTYGKSVMDEGYCTGEGDTLFSENRRVFYIIPQQEEYDNWEKTFTITSAKADSSDARVSVDKEKNMVRVEILDGEFADPNDISDFHVRVKYDRYEQRYKEEDGTWVKDGDPEERSEDRHFWFHYASDDQLPSYSDKAKANIEKAEAFEDAVFELPMAITADMEGAVKEVEAKYTALTKDQKAIVEQRALTKLDRAKTDLAAALQAKAAADKAAQDAAKAAEDAKNKAVKAAVDAANKTAAAEKKKAEAAAKTAGINSTSPKAKTILYHAGSKSLYKVVKAAKVGSAGTVEYYSPFGSVTTMKIPQTIKFSSFTYKVVSVGAQAFKGQIKMKSVVIPKGITSIGANAFNGCKALATITVQTTTLNKVGANALKGINAKAVVKVPAAKKAQYTKLFKNKGQGKNVKVK